MGYQSEFIWNGVLPENALVHSSFFRFADFIYATWPENPDWSQSGDFVEVDGDLLITLDTGVKRKIPLFEYLDTTRLIQIPQEFSDSGFLLEVVLQTSFSVNLQLIALVRQTSTPLALDVIELALAQISEAVAPLEGLLISIANTVSAVVPSPLVPVSLNSFAELPSADQEQLINLFWTGF